MKATTSEHADRLLLDLIELRRSGGEVAVLARLAARPGDENRAIGAINRLAGANWRWAKPRWRRIADYVGLAVDGWPLADRVRRPIAAPKRKPAWAPR